MTPEEGRAIVDKAILAKTLPECYRLINELLKDPRKEIVIAAKRMLPKGYSEAFEK